MTSSSLQRASRLSRLVWAVSLGGLAIALPAYAGTCSLVPSDEATLADVEISSALEEGKYADLEKQLAAVQKQGAANGSGDLMLLRALMTLGTMQPEENMARMWVDEQPKSFLAQLNAGMYYAGKAQNARSTGPASSVSSSQAAAMRKFDQTALGYLKAAMALNPKSPLPHAILVTIAGREGQADGKTAEQWLQNANQVDPKNLSARLQAVNYLSPRWGGSFEQLDQMVAQASKALSPANAQYLQYNVVLAKASHFEVIEHDKAKAQALYKQARSMCDNSTVAREGMVRTYK